MIEGNPFIDDASTMPDKGGAAGKPSARFDGSRIANEFDWNKFVESIAKLGDSAMTMTGQIIGSKNGAGTDTPTVVVQKKDNSVVWILVGLVVVVLVVGLLFFMKRRK